MTKPSINYLNDILDVSEEGGLMSWKVVLRAKLLDHSTVR